MSITTNVPAIQFTPTGIVLPTEAQILAGVMADQNAAAGGTLTTTLTSPTGQIAQSTTAIIGDKNNQIAEIVNQFDPNNASGRFQDGIGQLYFMTRIPGAGSVFTASCVGLVGVTVQAGALVQDSAGYLWASEANFIFSADGTASPTFQCQTDGPIAIPSGALTIYKATSGWDSITGPGAGTLGTLVESQADFEYRRKNSVAANAQGSTAAILGSVLGVPDVLDAYVIDNPTSAPVVVGSSSYTVAANSVYVAVVGGAAQAIAQAIWVKKSPGCNYNGNTSATVIDTANTGNPQYPVTWETPSPLPIYFAVQIANNPLLPSNIIALAQAAILAAFTGADGGSRARIASTQYAGRYYAGVSAVDSNVELLSILLGTAPSPSGTAVHVGIDQVPTLVLANIAVTLV